jgi:hypothetical protein
MRYRNVWTALRWSSAFVNATLHSCAPAYAADIHGLTVAATPSGDEASLDKPVVDWTGRHYGEGCRQGCASTLYPIGYGDVDCHAIVMKAPHEWMRRSTLPC